ncbi:hypothetical protein CQW23_05643 [Capsicum baccatum]|uniref:Uncharacterized protein n=1 Tax=Capsicum baccatum TaxID=33114 RepID=A0A2G2XI60_CAPBA|nr:hypothetical protein CQW23_05643 [Capsicum baccatum]
MAERKNRIQSLESSADNGVDNKQRTIMTEVIMAILPNLDTIQVLDENAAVVEQLKEHNEAERSLPNAIPFSELSKGSALEVRHCGFMKDGVVDELEELLRGVLDEETSVHDSVDIREDEVLQYDKGDLTAFIVGPENTHSSNKIEENTEVLERDAAGLIDIPKEDKEDATSLNEDEKISDVDDKVSMEKNDKELEQSGTASDGFSQSQEGTITTKQPTDTTNTEELDVVLPEKMQNAVGNDIEILDSGKTM